MEISQMLTISTSHISNETAKLLDESDLGIVVFNKGEYGWFIWLSDKKEYYENEKIPTDLFKIMDYTKHIVGCEWLCLDVDGEILDVLNTYEW